MHAVRGVTKGGGGCLDEGGMRTGGGASSSRVCEKIFPGEKSSRSIRSQRQTIKLFTNVFHRLHRVENGDKEKEINEEKVFVLS